MENTERKLIELILGRKKDDSNRKSCLMMALNSANDIITFKDLKKDFEDIIFSALILYLIFLEQVGIIFKKKTNYISTGNEIEAALLNFSCINNPDDAKAIRFLRNTFAHNYGLATDNFNKPYPKYKFTLIFSGIEGVVEHSAIPWDNDYNNKMVSSSTKIHVWHLITAITNVYNQLVIDLKTEI